MSPPSLHYVYPSPLEDATLIKRYKRFLADVERADGSVLTVHAANPGSMRTCSEPGSPVRIRDSGNPKRKLRFNLEQVKSSGVWVAVNTALPNRVVGEALRRGEVDSTLRGLQVNAEVSDGDTSRIDFRLESGVRRCWIEVKNVTLRVGRDACFPDAVTERGRKHLGALTRLVAKGDRAVMLYVVARAGLRRFRAAREIDPAYAKALDQAVASGVEVMACQLLVTRRGLQLGERLPFASPPR